MIRRRSNKRREKESKLSPTARSFERKLAAMGVKPIEDIDELAFLKPKEAEELLDAIKEFRKASGDRT